MTSRRKFIKACIPAATLPFIASAENSQINHTHKLHPLPPGAISLQHFLSACTACHLCINHCPSQVIRAAFLDNGIRGILTPVLKYDVHKFCEYECTTCIDVCPTNALAKISLDEKKLTQIGKVRLAIENCVVIKNDEDCGACAEHCPTAAIKMVPYKNGLTQPEITNPEMCIGCGACESICPELKRAIYIERLEEQTKATPPSVEEQKKVIIDDFGF